MCPSGRLQCHQSLISNVCCMVSCDTESRDYFLVAESFCVFVLVLGSSVLVSFCAVSALLLSRNMGSAFKRHPFGH